MARCQHLVFAVIVICGICITFTDAEIHRAKAAAHKTGVKPRRNSDVAFDPNRGDMLAEDATSSHEVWIYSLFGAVLVGLSGIFPLLVIPIESGPALKHGAAASKLKLLLSFAVGGLLGDVFLHLLPEAWAHLDKDNIHSGHTQIGLWIITGILMFLVIEKTFGDEDEFKPLGDECEVKTKNKSSAPAGHRNCVIEKKNLKDDNKTQNVSKAHQRQKQRQKEKQKMTANGVKLNGPGKKHNIHEEKKVTVPKSSNNNEKEHIKVSGYLNLMANCIDNFTHGLAVAGSFLVGPKVGVLTTIAILLHEVPHEVGDFAILLRSGFDRWKAAKAQLLTATGGVVGALTALMADSAESAGQRTAWILPFTSGGFLYIALITVVPDLLTEKHGWESFKQVLCLCAGIGVMCGVTLIC